MDIRKVKKLIELLEDTGVAEIEIKEGEESVRISRYASAGAPPVQQVHYAAAPAAAASVAQAPAAASAPAAPAARASDQTITAPMVGTFYAAATPGAKPFVEIGSTVSVGDTLCIIEAMKMMNQIESDKAGRVVSVMAKNGEPVEFGQPLFIIE